MFSFHINPKVILLHVYTWFDVLIYLKV